MKMQINTRTLICGMSAAVLALVVMMAGWPVTALAQGDVDVVKEPSEEEHREVHEITHVLKDSDGYIGEEALLANALGLAEDELDDVYQKAFELALAQAVTDGDLTQAQADELLADEHGYLMLEEFADDDQMNQFLAQAVGMNQADFDAALDGAIQKAADDGLITQAQANDMLLEKLIEERVEAAYKEALDEGASLGLITQSQADQMKVEPMGGFEHDEEVIVVEPFGHSRRGPFGFEFGEGDMDENCVEIRGSHGMVHVECFDFDGTEEFEHGFRRGVEEFEFFGHPREDRRSWFQMPEIFPFR